MQKSPSEPGTALLRFVRHGATAPNLAGLRCGGDLDPPLTDIGRRQAGQAARQLAGLGLGLVITSDLQRTRETAALIAHALGGLPVQVLPGWAERHLGAWNLQPIDQTQAALAAGQTPPGGESDADFTRRIRRASLGLADLLPRRPLLVGSKGVARVLAQLSGQPSRGDLDNGVLCQFDLSALLCREPAQENA